MATYLLRPNGDAKADWAEDPAGPANAVLDDDVTQPTAPSTAGDFITSGTDGQLCNVDMTTTTLAGGETPTSAKVWVYAATPAGRNFTVQLGGVPGAPQGTFPANTAAGWINTTTYTGSLTQAEIDGVRVQFQAGNGTGTVTVYAAYVELTTLVGVSRMMMGMG